MNVLVYIHDSHIGGSQINALELAASVQASGHNVIILMPDGPLTSMASDLRLKFILEREASNPLGLRSLVRLLSIAVRCRIDLIHTYEWGPALTTVFGPHLLMQTPVVMTVLSMDVPGFLPHHLPLIVGTHALAEHSTDFHRRHVIEPPIDVHLNTPITTRRESARARWNFLPDDVVVGSVCRISSDLDKVRGVLETIRAAGFLAETHPIKFLIAGDGDYFEHVSTAAETINDRIGKEVIVMAGAMLDPRPAYDASDIVVGMGSSALRGLAFGKPLIVQGESGFCKLLDAGSLPLFRHQGWFGSGSRDSDDLIEVLARLTYDTVLRRNLGTMGRRLVEEQFSLGAATRKLLSIYEASVAGSTMPERWSALSRSALRTARWKGSCARSSLCRSMVRGIRKLWPDRRRPSPTPR